MTRLRWVFIAITTISFIGIVSAVSDYIGLPPGPYCGAIHRGCCPGRVDDCSAPIIGTLCYCDDFCNRTRNEDCCPDFLSFCKGIIDIPPEPIKTCYYKGQYYGYGKTAKENCNICKCEPMEDKLEMLCERNVCLMEENIINTVNDMSEHYGWTASNYSEFWGRHLDEGIKLRLGTLQPHRFVRTMNPVRRIYDPNALPHFFDAEEKWPSYISPVQNQGWCGSSWALSTAATASDRFAVVSQGLERVQLSPQNLLSCNNRGQQSCNGGYLDKAWLFLRKFGVVDENCYPYTGHDGKCRIPKKGNLLTSRCAPPYNVDRKEKYKVGPAYRLGNETDIMYEIIQSGPVQATLKVYHDFFSYRGGVYRHTDLSAQDRTGYHSVRIIGWGQEQDYRGRVQKYWKVANSWGREWGENGYFRIVRGTNECEIESFVLATWPLTVDPVSKNDVYGISNWGVTIATFLYTNTIESGEYWDIENLRSVVLFVYLMDRIIRPVFTLELNYKIVPGLVTVGKYDGTHPCLTAATTADKVLIHSPHRRSAAVTGRVVWSESNREIATLTVNQSITSLVAGKLLPNEDKDVLIIGTPTHVLAYHVHDNRDIFYKECQDGVKAVTLGNFSEFKTPLVLVGGNSSVHGFDHTGNEVFWTAVGDVVTCLTLLDFTKNGSNELIVSSEDYSIRVYKGDKIIGESVETEIVTGLASLPESRFAYSVSNGTVGVYEQDMRLWRVKSKNFALSIYFYDLLGQGSCQLITGWSNGKIDCRSIKTGEVLFKDSVSHSVAGIVEADYRSIGKTDLICLTVEGEVRGYTTTKSITTANGVVSEQDTVRELLSQKQALLLELKHYENNTKYNDDYSRQEYGGSDNVGVIPANTRLQIGISTNDETKLKPHVEISVSTNNNTIIRAVIVFAEGIFKGETNVVHPPSSKLNSELSVPIVLPKDIPIDIHIKALVGYPNSIQYHVFELTRQLPRFSMYALNENKPEKLDSYVEFHFNERLQRVCMWINQNFLLPTDMEYESGPNLNLNVKCLRDNTDLVLNFEASGKTMFYTENLLLASDLIQSLTGFCNTESLESKASFPKEEEKLKQLMETLSEIQESRLRLGTDIADRLGQIRNLVVRAEDSRINNISEMSKYYNELSILNTELINGYNIRLANYKEGVEAMKYINSVIQKASRLRVGQKSASLINHCRNAIKNNNVEGLIKIIQNGQP